MRQRPSASSNHTQPRESRSGRELKLKPPVVLVRTLRQAPSSRRCHMARLDRTQMQPRPSREWLRNSSVGPMGGPGTRAQPAPRHSRMCRAVMTRGPGSEGSVNRCTGRSGTGRAGARTNRMEPFST